MSALPEPEALASPARRFEGRVLFVHQSADLYGSDRVLLDTVLELQRRGGEAIVALPHEGPLTGSLRAASVETHVLGPMNLLKLTRALMTPKGVWCLYRSAGASLRALDACARGRRIDAVQSNTLAVLGGALWSRARGVPHVWHVHEIVERPRIASLLFPQLLHRYADRVVCNSGATQRWLTRRKPSLADRSEVVHNGVADVADRAGAANATHPGTQRAMRAAFRPLGQRLAIGLVGRFNRMKGHAVLIDAAERLARRGIRDFSLVFIGSAPPQQEHYADTLRDLIDASPIGARVTVHGFMADLRDAYAALDIVCVPSTEAEAFGLVAVEAMAAGCTVVASRIGGLPEIVEDGVSGLLHRPGDAADLAEQLALLIEDDGWREDLAGAGRDRYQREFRVETMTSRLLGLLASTIEKH